VPLICCVCTDNTQSNNPDVIRICYGDVDCAIDVKAVPKAGQEIDVWKFEWGSDQMGITPGHIEAVWQWVPL